MNASKNIKTFVIARHEAISTRRLLHSFFVRNDVNKWALFLILILGITTSSFTQNSNKKRVLVIPPSRFEFMSEFKLEKIAEKNSIKPSEVFLTYEKALLSSFETYKDDNFQFVAIDNKGAQEYKGKIKYGAGKFNGKNYNAVDLSRFSEEEFTKFLEQYQADFVIFITWYDIKRGNYSRSGLKKVKYASHYLDFDIYNLFKQQVVGVAKVKAEAPEPNDLQASFSLLRTQEVKVAYANFIGKVIEQLNKPIDLK